jgi:hypothetical protein
LKNESYTFPIITGKSNSFKYALVLLKISFPLTLVFPLAIGANFSPKLMQIASICCSLGILFMLSPFMVKVFFGKYKKNGAIKLDASSISIINSNGMYSQAFPLHSLSDIFVKYIDSERNIRMGYYGVYGGDGIGNIIKFQDRQGNNYEFQFQIDDERKLKRILSLWKEENIPFHLYNRN